MDVLLTHKQVVEDYASYIQSFLNIADPAIRSTVENKLAEGRLWPEPLLQFNPAYESAGTVDEVAAKGILHPAIPDILKGYSLYKHQVDAIKLGTGDRDFIVTSGTGSGKSLTYIGTIFHDLLSRPSEGGIRAVIVYPMNALINSQFEEFKRYQENYEKATGKAFPISFGQYTGQEKEEAARIERVYESKIQFVELELTGYRLSAKRVNIPNDLLVGEEKAFKERLKNSFLLLQGEQTIKVRIPVFDLDTAEPKPAENGCQPPTVEWSEATLEEQRKALYDEFLISVPRFGHVIMRRNRPDFDKRLKLLEAQIKAFNTAIQKELGGKLTDAVKALAQTLLPRIRDRLPQRYKRVLPVSAASDDLLLSILEQDLATSFGSSAEVFKPELRWVFKDVTYESISDPLFREALGKALRDSGGERLVAQLFSEHDAAPEV